MLYNKVGARGARRRPMARGWPARALSALFCCALLSILGLLSITSSRVASALDDGSKSSLNEGPAVGTQTLAASGTATVPPTHTTLSWENVTLRELADELAWPPVVAEDGAKLSISLTLTTTEQAQISIRSFDFSAGAVAAFAAEQEDARLAGLQVTTRRFDVFPAYSAVHVENGVSHERRLHWVSDAWIFSVDVLGTGQVMQSLDTSNLASRLLQSAIQHGLPVPGGATPTTEPTPGQPPSATPTASTCRLSFTDVGQDYWAYSHIAELACAGVISGYSDGTFRPQNSTTRAQFAKMIVLSEGWTLANPARPTFRDVDGSHLFYRYIETAYAHGVASGYNGELFRPDSYVKRAQVAKMLVRARGWVLTGQTSVALCDVPASHWAWTYIQIAIQHNAFAGYANGCFYPDAYATRAQLAKVIAQARH
jgi:hypothetical protein